MEEVKQKTKRLTVKIRIKINKYLYIRCSDRCVKMTSQLTSYDLGLICLCELTEVYHVIINHFYACVINYEFLNAYEFIQIYKCSYNVRETYRNVHEYGQVGNDTLF